MLKPNFHSFLVLCLGCACQAAAALPFPEKPSWTMRGEAPDSSFGFRACFAGDVNGDGYSDLIIGAPGYDHGRGKAYLYLGGPQGLAAKPSWVYEGEAAGEGFGDRVGSAGDVNGDKFSDIYVAAASWKKGLGKLYVFYGGPQGPAAQPSWTAHGSGSPPLSFGDCTIPTGDLNGDGYDDLAVGAYGYDGTRGEVFVYFGSKHGLAPKPAWRAQGESKGDQFGYGIGPAGDVNRDGYDDLVIASKYHSQGHPQAGKAYLYLGSAQGPQKFSWTAVGSSQGANLGTRVYGVGNLNGDGFPDILVGAPYAQSGTGEVLAFAGSKHGLDAQPFLHLQPAQGQTAFGYCLGPLGKREFFISSRKDSGGEVDIFEADGKAGARLLQRLTSALKKDRFGQWCAPAGDLNGDGVPDLCISADADGPGRVDIYYGSSSPSKNPEAGQAYFIGRHL